MQPSWLFRLAWTGLKSTIKNHFVLIEKKERLGFDCLEFLTNF